MDRATVPVQCPAPCRFHWTAWTDSSQFPSAGSTRFRRLHRHLPAVPAPERGGGAGRGLRGAVRRGAEQERVSAGSSHWVGLEGLWVVWVWSAVKVLRDVWRGHHLSLMWPRISKVLQAFVINMLIGLEFFPLVWCMTVAQVTCQTDLHFSLFHGHHLCPAR